MSKRRYTSEEVSRLRDAAIDLHNRKASYLEFEYGQMRTSDHYASAFTYGRAKIDDVLLRLLHATPRPASVLDIGCGTGEQVKMCRELGFSVSAVEPSSEMRALACRRNRDAVIIDGSITDLPFATGKFDVVLAIEVLRYLHSEDIERAYGEMYRLLKPGGRMLFTLVNRFALDGFWLYHQLKLLRGLFLGTPVDHCEFVTPHAAAKGLERLEIDRFEQYGRMFAPLRIAYRVGGGFGRWFARVAETFDDATAEWRWTVPLAGHLIVVAEKGKE